MTNTEMFHEIRLRQICAHYIDGVQTDATAFNADEVLYDGLVTAAPNLWRVFCVRSDFMRIFYLGQKENYDNRKTGMVISKILSAY